MSLDTSKCSSGGGGAGGPEEDVEGEDKQGLLRPSGLHGGGNISGSSSGSTAVSGGTSSATASFNIASTIQPHPSTAGFSQLKEDSDDESVSGGEDSGEDGEDHESTGTNGDERKISKKFTSYLSRKLSQMGGGAVAQTRPESANASPAKFNHLSPDQETDQQVSHAEPRTGVAADSFSRLPVASHDLPTPSTVPTSPLPPTGTTSDTNNQQQSTLASKTPNKYSQQNVSLTHPLLPHQQQNQGQGGEERQLPAPSSPTNQSPHVVIQVASSNKSSASGTAAAAGSRSLTSSGSCQSRAAAASAVAASSSKPPSRGSQASSSKPDPDCFSWQFLCGPNPKKAVAATLLFLTIWASLSIGFVLLKTVSVIEKELDYMKSEYVDLRTKFKEHKKSTDQEIMALKRLLHSSSGTTIGGNYLPPTPSDRRHFSDENLEGGGCKTEGGVRCLFPFVYKGGNKTDCVQNWGDRKPWCATSLDDKGQFVSSMTDNSNWDYCDFSTGCT